jgi:hypothetical protein
LIVKKSFLWLIVLTGLLVCFAVLRDCHFLLQSSVATGIDGYYYVLQVETLRNQGHLYFATHTPLVLWLLAALSYLTQDTILAIKIGAVVMHLFLALGVMALLTAITRNAWFGVCGLLIATLAGLHFFFISEFLSQLGALAFLVWAAWAAAEFVRRKKAGWLGLSLLFLLGAIFSHRSTIGLVVLNGFTVSAAYLLTNDRFSRRFRLLSCAIVMVLFGLPLAWVWQPLWSVPQELKNELLKIPRLPFRQVDLAERWMSSAAVVMTTFTWFRCRQVLLNNAAGLTLVSMALWSCLITLNPFLNHQTGVVGIVGRLGMMTYLQAAIAVPLLLALLFEVSGRMVFLTGLFFLPFLALSYFAPLPLSLRKEYLQDRDSLVAELPKLRAQLCEKPFIVARHGDEFLVTAVVKVPSQQKPPVEQQQCVYWLIYQPPAVSLVGPSSIATPNNDFVLVEDRNLKLTLASVSQQQYRQLLAANSHLRDLAGVRPR